MSFPSRTPSAARTFADRHIGPDTADLGRMVAAAGVDDPESLIDAAVPASIRQQEPLALPPAGSEADVLAELEGLAERNQVLTSMIGMGYHDTITPPVLRRNILENPAWYTAYTPYQPEIAQGRLEALLCFQTMVAELSGCELANASLLDEATAAAEAMTLCRRRSKVAGGAAFVVDTGCHPQTLAVIATRAEPLGIEVITRDLRAEGLGDEACFGVLAAVPTSTGELWDATEVFAAAHEQGALAAATTDLLAACVTRPPGEMGADVVVGSAQRFGVPMGFGGPHAGFMAVTKGLERALPGRLVGVSVDVDGATAYRLALQTREQHIRREKATSNICTAQVLLAVMSAMYAVWHGPAGLAAIATRVHRQAAALAGALAASGIEICHPHLFDTVTVRVPGRARGVVDAARAGGINLRLIDDDTVGITCDERTTGGHLRAVVRAAVADATDEDDGAVAALDDATLIDVTFDGAAPGTASGEDTADRRLPAVPDDLVRTSSYCTHETFGAHRSETAMLRYLRRLSDRDLALDRTMIPLGSCTMKLNATAEMEPISWAGFADVHPFAPADQREGYTTLIGDLERWLCELTGYDAVSLQPNAGSQGELSGLLAIRGYHRANGEADRDVCLIPESAHGTNAASAVMAGMRVSVLACDDQGNVDVAALDEEIATHGDRLAALMVTYPSTHGVFEEAIGDICAKVHDAGGQVYLDGANLNAMVGVARPGHFGADVSHLNLHKTFCIPHGGGGPGVGPVGARAHLAPHLPNHPLADDAGPATGPGPVSAAPWGSAGILPISWAYLRLMGPDGLRRATVAAIASANYVAARLADHYPVLYTGRDGHVAHEAILDLRPLDKETGVTVEDVAKRLIDHGIHAPTMSFPVAGTLMVEPTESEDLAELDRFCEAMIAIRAEIDHSPALLADAPFTVAAVTADAWDRPYARSVAAFPTGSRADRYFPPVRRIDQGYGDRNLMCSCPPTETLAEAESRAESAPAPSG